MPAWLFVKSWPCAHVYSTHTRVCQCLGARACQPPALDTSSRSQRVHLPTALRVLPVPVPRGLIVLCPPSPSLSPINRPIIARARACYGGRRYVSLLPSVSSLSAMRTFRVLRPLRTLTSLPSIRVVVRVRATVLGLATHGASPMLLQLPVLAGGGGGALPKAWVPPRISYRSCLSRSLAVGLCTQPCVHCATHDSAPSHSAM